MRACAPMSMSMMASLLGMSPADVTRMSAGPSSLSTWRAAASTAAASATSQVAKCPPSDFATASAPARLLSRIATAQPSAARRRAVASPIPLAPPVITATRLSAMPVLRECALDVGREHSNTPRPRSRPILPSWIRCGDPKRGGRACRARRARVSADAKSTAFSGRRPMIEYGHFIGGKEVKGTSGRAGDVFEPMTGELRARVAFAAPAEVAAAVANAKAAQPRWAATNPQRRARVLMKFLELANRDYDKLADCLAREHGKTIADAKGDVQRGLEVVEFACGIPPFNFPAMIPLWKCAPAIACGNAFILKPSERDPGVPLMLANLFMEAGL